MCSMSDKKDSREKGLDIDLDAFEVEIEKEIDSLFVPFEAEEQPLTVQVLEEPAPVSSEPAVAPEAVREQPQEQENSLGIDLGVFETQIDKEIDSLFVPVGPSGTDDAFPILTMDSEPAPPPPAPATAAAGSVKKAGQAPSARESAKPSREELIKLLETFSIAYLSLDWDFSVENISRLESALGDLEPHCQGSGRTQTLYKILKAVLHRFKTKPSAINPQLVELVRDSQELLRALLLAKGNPSAQEVEMLKTIISRFNALKERAVEAKPEKAEPAAVSKPPMGGPVPSAPPVNLGRDDQLTLKEMIEWIEGLHDRMDEAMQGLAEGNRRIAQIEDILGKTPALAPLRARLGNIRASMERQTALLGEDDWAMRISWLRGLEKNVEPMEKAEVRETAPVADPVLPKPAVPEEKKVRKAQVCLFDLADRRYALLASQVVKVEQISAKKIGKILKRGYATLGDFKPLFRSIKTGLFGVWSGLPENVLKSYRFLPLDVPGAGDDRSKCCGAVLISNGREHGIIFTRSAAVDLQNETPITEIDGDGPMLGTILSESGSTVEVLDVERVLRTSGSEASA